MLYLIYAILSATQTLLIITCSVVFLLHTIKKFTPPLHDDGGAKIAQPMKACLSFHTIYLTSNNLALYRHQIVESRQAESSQTSQDKRCAASGAAISFFFKFEHFFTPTCVYVLLMFKVTTSYSAHVIFLETGIGLSVTNEKGIRASSF